MALVFCRVPVPGPCQERPLQLSSSSLLVSVSLSLAMSPLSRASVLLSLVALVPAVLAGSRPERELEEIPVILPEQPCLAAGGHCVHESKCPADKVNLEVECTEQKHLGALCCHSAHPPGETRCEALAGECKKECADDLKVVQASNCAEGEVCCTLV